MMIFTPPLSNELYEQMGLWSPKEGWETSVNHPTAGSYRAIGLDLQGASPEQAARLKQQLEATKAKLESEFGGLSMDIDHMKAQRNSKTNNKEESIAFSQSIGARMSAMEHLVPE